MLSETNTSATRMDAERYLGIRQAFLMAAEGRPVRVMLEELRSAGLSSPNNRPFTLATLWRHLRDEAYASQVRHWDPWYARDAVVSEALFREAQEKLSKKRRSTRHPR